MSKMSGKKGFILGILFTLFTVFIVLPVLSIGSLVVYHRFIKTPETADERFERNAAEWNQWQGGRKKPGMM